MRFQSGAGKLFERIESATHEAGEDILRYVQQRTPKLTGRLASSYELVEVKSEPGHVILAIASDLPYAGAIERGAWVRGGRGPHISGSGKGRHTLRNGGRTLGRRMNARLRGVG